MKRSIPLRVSMMRHSVVAAMVLGTALSSLGQTPAAESVSEDALRAVGDICRYCTACWRNARLDPDCWTDCTQDVFVRLLERVDLADWERVLVEDADERREFLRAIDAVKKRTQRSHKYAALVEDAVPDRHDPNLDERAADRAAVAQVAAEVLSNRQQRILQLSFEGATVQEVADELCLPPERVSDEKYKAIRKLRLHLGVESEQAG